VLATENPIEMEGTYPLPEAQLDRFLLKVVVPSPDEAALTDILRATTGQPAPDVTPVLTAAEVLELRSLCRDVTVTDPVLAYAARLVTASSPEAPSAPPLVKRALRFGAGVRGAQALILTAKAVALLDGRGHVAFADVARVSPPVLRHRVIRSFEGEAEGIAIDRVLAELLETVPPRPEGVERAVREAG
jgi:MoxR-like ATPase